VSGVRAETRAGFRELLATVLGGRATFEVILVYDVSRWGRFQDPDEAGHYEFLCLQEGVRIEYCAEALGAAGGVGEALLKGLKRAVAAEFSRDLGRRVRDAQARRAALGHWQNGPPGFGFRRRLVGPSGEAGEVLQAGDRKALREAHTVLVKGPAKEVALVREIHRRFTEDGLTIAAIARRLNAEGATAENGAPWTFPRVRQVLTNPKYMGDVVSFRRETPLGGRRRWRPREAWIVAKGAAPALISRKTFAATQAALAARAPLSDEALLAQLAPVAAAHGVIGEARLKQLGVAHWRAYRQRFGSLRQAFAQLGCAPSSRAQKRLTDREMLQRLAQLALDRGRLAPALIDAAADLPCADAYRRRFGALAAAYAAIGYVHLSRRELASPVGQARLAARTARLRAVAARGRGACPAAA
jgi:DNA invertase Pin-like site-specific DNA recombinase